MTSMIGLIPRLEALGRESANVPQFVGDIYYVDASQADDSGDGTSPDTAKKTIGAAVALLGAGDAVTVKAGTYAENVVMSLDACELWCEIGTFIAPAAGVAITLSGDSCRLRGVVWVYAVAGQIGINITGDFAYVQDVVVIGGTVGFAIAGEGCFLFDCRAGVQTVTGFDTTGSRGILDRCATAGTGGATRGFYIHGGADIGVLSDCTSVSHALAGYEIATGSEDWTIKGCASGSGDGRWKDADFASTWPGFQYDDELTALQTMNGGTTYNLWKVTGTVRISDIYGVVETQIQNTASTLYLQLYSTGGTDDITDAPGTNIQAAVVGSTLIRNEDSASAIALGSAATPTILESSGYKNPTVPVDVVADADQTTYIRVVLSALLNTGAIRWRCHWRPLSVIGFLEEI